MIEKSPYSLVETLRRNGTWRSFPESMSCLRPTIQCVLLLFPLYPVFSDCFAIPVEGAVQRQPASPETTSGSDERHPIRPVERLDFGP